MTATRVAIIDRLGRGFGSRRSHLKVHATAQAIYQQFVAWFRARFTDEATAGAAAARGQHVVQVTAVERRACTLALAVSSRSY